MSTNPLRKIDKFFPVLVVTMLLLAALVIFAFRGIFSSFVTAFESEPEAIDSKLRIDKNKIDDAVKEAFEKEKIPLKVVEVEIVESESSIE